jgi:hypothetical protein
MKHLSNVAQEERHFWRSALALQHDLWPMATGPGTGATRPLQVNYGYYDGKTDLIVETIGCSGSA